MTDHSVQVQELCVKFGDFFAVNHISFSVKRGEIFGFLGANGAGKTTTIRVLCGLLVPSSGEVSVAGVNIQEGENAIKSKVGYMSQKFTLYNDLTIEENLNFTAALRKLDRSTYLARRKELLEFIGFDRSLNTLVQDLPGGLKQQVSLATSLLHDPEIVFLDEPTAGVSPNSRQRFWALIRELAQNGKTVFVTTHYMDEAEQCERIALMRDGQIIALDSPEKLKNHFFGGPIYEFEPKQTLSFQDILNLKNEPLFSFFEPYGLRFHAAIKKPESWEQHKSKFDRQFYIRSIEASLEDVFIRAVEGKS